MMVDKVRLIELVRERVSLWDQRDKHYHNRDLRAKLWDEVGEELGIEGGVARKTWDLLRDMLRKKIKDNAGVSGAATKTKWLYFDSLNFLIPMMKSRVTSGSLPNCEVTMDEESSETPLSEYEFYVQNEIDETAYELEEIPPRQPTPSTTTTIPEASRKVQRSGSKRRLSQSIPNEVLDLDIRKDLDTRLGAPQPTRSTEEDDDLLFFKSLLPSMRQLPHLRRMKLRSTILNCVISELESDPVK